MKNPVVLVAEKDFGSGVTQKVLLTVEHGERYNMLDLLSSSSKLLGVIDVCPMKIDTLDGLPVIVFDESSAKLNGSKIISYSLHEVERAIINRGVDPVRLRDILLAQKLSLFPALAEEHLCYFLDFVSGPYKSYCTRELSIKIEYRNSLLDVDRTKEVKDSINRMNLSSSLTTKYISSGQNVATLQSKPDDRFFIALPKYEEFKASSVISTDYPTAIRDIYKPFAHKAYSSPVWLRLLNRSEAQRRNVLLQENRIRNYELYTENDITNWIDYPESHILGNPDNDDIPIMDNEIEWYNAFIDFMKVDLAESYGEEIAGDMFETGGMSSEMEEFFDTVLESILAINWSCAGRFRVPTKEELIYDDDDGDRPEPASSANDNVAAEFLYYQDTNPECFDGMEAIKSYVKYLARGSSTEKPLGCEVYAEALVKLARWGDRRPSSLKIKGRDTVFSLTRFSEETASVDLSKLVVEKVNGRELSLLGYVKMTWVLQDNEYKQEQNISGKMVDVPVGVIAVKTFSGEKHLTQITYVSMLDIVSEYVAGNQFVDGIDLNSDGKFQVDMDLDSYSEDLITAKNHIDSGRSRIVFLPSRLEDVARDINVKASALTDLSVLLEGSRVSGGSVTLWTKQIVLENRNDMAHILSSNSMPALKAMQFRILKHIMPLYFKYADEISNLSGDDFSEYLTVLYNVSERTSIRNSSEFYTVGQERRTDVVKKLTAFGAVSSTQPQEPEAVVDTPIAKPAEKVESIAPVVEVSEAIPVDVAAEKLAEQYVYADHSAVTQVHPVAYVKSAGTEPVVVAYYGPVLIDVDGMPMKSGVFFAESEVPANAVKGTKPININTFSIFFLRLLGEMIEGIKPKAKPTMFASVSTVKKILGFIQRSG